MSKTKNFWISLVGGIFIGLINGFFGGGGGMLAVPILCAIFSGEEKYSHATAILVILPISIVSCVVYFLNNSFNFLQILWVGIGVIYGAIIGALLLKNLNGKVITIIFAIIMAIAGVRMVI